MAHDHDHGESGSEYYIEQLFTILVCGSLGLVAIRMYLTNKLQFVLAPTFHLPVLIGGCVILLLVALRAVALWRESGRASNPLPGNPHHDHDHSDCNHDHGHAHSHVHSREEVDADHGHSHDLSWTFVRLLILVFPVTLYMLGVPNAGYSQDYLKKLLDQEVSLGPVEFGDIQSTGKVTEVRFNDLNDAAYDPAKRESYQDQFVVITGRLQKLGDKEFTLFKLKMTCCAADTVPLKVRIITRNSLNSYKDMQWVRVKGQVQFLQPPSSSRYYPVIKATEVQEIPPPPGGDYE